MRVGVVVPWCSEKPIGGVESLALHLVKQFQGLGHEAELLTTTGQSAFSSWDGNHFESGVERHTWGNIRRFSLDRRNHRLFEELFGRLHSGHPLTWLEEQQFLLQKVSSLSMYRYIEAQGADYTVIGLPYYYGLVYWALRAARGATGLIPCLHDEPEAHLRTTARLLMASSRVFINSHPEFELMRQILPPGGADRVRARVTGQPVSERLGDAGRFQAKFSLTEPFLLYVGRKVAGKRLPEILEFFKEARRELRSDLKLVIVGPGSLKDIGYSALPQGVVDLGELPEEDKADAMAAAAALCHFSALESFSLVLMEAWLQRTPAIVRSDAAVLQDHLKRSQGGWVVGDRSEFTAAVREALRPQVRAKRGARGQNYALQFTGTRIARGILDELAHA